MRVEHACMRVPCALCTPWCMCWACVCTPACECPCLHAKGLYVHALHVRGVCMRACMSILDTTPSVMDMLSPPTGKPTTVTTSCSCGKSVAPRNTMGRGAGLQKSLSVTWVRVGWG